MWTSLFFGLPGFVSAQEDDFDDDEAVVTDFVPEGRERKIPTPEEILKIIDSMDLSEKEKKSLFESVMRDPPAAGAGGGAGAGAGAEKVFVAAATDFTSQTLILLALLSLIALIFGN